MTTDSIPLETRENAQPCWVCDSARGRIWRPGTATAAMTPDDVRVTDDRYGQVLTLWRCPDCGFAYADARELGDLTALYEAVEDTTYLDTAAPRRLQMRWLLDEVQRLRPAARTALDIGAAAGLLVAEGRDRGLDIVGVEPSRAFCQAASDHFGVTLVNGTYPHPDLGDRRFDVVFLVDVIEHVADPLQLLTDAADALAPGGLLVCVTPDLESLAARALGPRWWHFRLAHVGYFARRSFLVAAARADLQVESTKRAQWFFPVDYLVDRVAQYLPVSSMVSAARKLPGIGRLIGAVERRVIPLDLKDSWVFFAARPPPKTRR